MRNSLRKLIDDTVVLEYLLPNGEIKCTNITNHKDYCFSTTSNEDVASIIYNGIIDYALGEHNVNFFDLNKEQTRAIAHHIRFKEDADDDVKEHYGFYGEVMLNLVLQKFLDTRLLIAKGYFYLPVSGQETHGYDAFHFWYNRNLKVTSLILGEAKFYQNQTSAIKPVIQNISKALSTEYFNKNFYTIFTLKEKTEQIPNSIASIFEAIDINPHLNVYEFVRNNNIKIVYPILIMCNQTNKSFDDKIKSLVDCVNSYVENIKPVIGVEVTIFFLFIPVPDSKTIKKEVIQWIIDKKLLMS